MKTTVEIDEKKLRRVMKMTGIKTRKATLDWALSRAEESARLNHLLKNALPPESFKDAVDPAYDLMAVREADLPRYHVARR